MFKKVSILFVVVVLLAKGVTLAFADTQPCQSMSCNSVSQPKANALTISEIPKDMSVADMFQKLKLSHEQYAALYEVIDKQLPKVKENSKNLAQAKNLLEDMALHKQYDEMIAGKLAQTIAESTANLAVLQAEREYELLAMLTPEQVVIYQNMLSKPLQ